MSEERSTIFIKYMHLNSDEENEHVLVVYEGMQRNGEKDALLLMGGINGNVRENVKEYIYNL